MIYEQVSSGAPIRQGDIFVGVPKIEIALSTFLLAEDDETRQTTWREMLAELGPNEVATAIVPVKPVTGIVITQNCDAVRGESIVLAEVANYAEMMGKGLPSPTKLLKFARKITQNSRQHLRLFYLPADPEFGFDDRSACDFRVLIRAPRSDLEEMLDLRVGRLNTEATEHFRETLAQYFRRYPYNEWYPLTREEFDVYQADSSEPISPYPWQKS